MREHITLTRFDVNSLALRLVIVNIFSIILHKQIVNDYAWSYNGVTMSNYLLFC